MKKSKSLIGISLGTLLRYTTALGFGAIVAATPLSVGGPGRFGLSIGHALAKDGGSDDKGGDKGGGGQERDTGDHGGRDEDRGREREDEVRGRETENEARGRETENEVRGREVEVRGREAEPGDDRATDRARRTAPLADDGFANHGERVETFVAIAKALGYDANVGAQQANFGTPQERGITPVDRGTDWQTANLDINRDGAVNSKDLDIALARRR
jgi:hypothetical protein